MKKMKKAVSGILTIVMILAILMSTAACADLGGLSVADVPSKEDVSSSVKPVSSTSGSSEGGLDMTEEELDAARKAFQEEQINELSDEFGEDFILSLKNLYALYDEDLYLWLASLYDPEIGGFYYSVSARNTEGFLPDIESTAQALGLLDKSGLDGVYNSVIGDALSDELQLQLYLFALSLYNSSDGYFYHPQWGTSISSARKGRDKSWGNDILNALDPNTDGDSNVYTYTDSQTLVVSLDTDLAESAYRVMSVTLMGDSVSSLSAVSDSADYSYSTDPENNPKASFSYDSWEELKAYIDYMLFVVGDSYSMGNTISASIGAIEDKGFRDEIVNYLIILSNEVYKNGFWETEISYNAINGVMKLCGIFGGKYAKFPNAYLTVSEIIDILNSELTNGELNDDAKVATKAIVYSYNQWEILYKLVNMMSTEEKALVAQALIDNSDALINGVYAKLALFKRDDGGFSYFQNKTSSTSQGASVAVPGACESDVNSTGIAISTIRYVLRVYQLYCEYEFDIPLIYCNEDMEYFLYALEAQEQVEKIQAVEFPETVTFDDEVVSPSVSEGVLLNPANTVTTNIVSKDEDNNGENDYFASSIAADPENSSNKVLSITVNTGAGSNCSTDFNITNYSMDSEIYVFEAKVYVENCSQSLISQIMFYSTTQTSESAKLNLCYDSGEGLYLQEDTYCKGVAQITDTVYLGVSTGEWFTLRMLLTRNYDGDTLNSITMQIDVNGNTVGTIDTGRTDSQSSTNMKQNLNINSTRWLHFRTNDSQYYIDNSYCAKTCDGENHLYVSSVIKQATCKQDGEILYTCPCGDSYSEQVEVLECYDNGSDHLCDTCKKVVSICADGDNNHYCDVCGAVLSTCADSDSDHDCDLCGETVSECSDNDVNAVCDVCGEAAITAYMESTDCTFGGAVIATAHAGEGLTVAPIYNGSTYTLDFWCVYSVSGDTVTLVATFEAGSSYAISAQGTYRITPVYLATTLAGVTDNTYSADTTTTDKTTSDNCLTAAWADTALSSKFNVYSSSSTAPLKTSNVTQLYVVADPTDAANNVLAWMTSGTSGTGYGNAVLTFDLDNSVQGNVYVIEFDYYVDYTYYSGASLYTTVGVTDSSANAYELARLNHGGAAMANYSLNPDNVVTPGSATSYYSVSTRTSAAAASGKKAVYDTDTWYSVKLVVDNDTVYTFIALRGTDDYTLIDAQGFAGINSADLSTLTITAGIYKNRSVIYYDNIGFYSTDTAPCVDGNGDCVCDICKEEAHSYTDTVTAPTCTERGYTTHTCNTCGNTVTDSLLPAKGHVYKEGVCDCGEIYAPAFDYLPTDTELEEGYLLAKDSEGNYTTVENTYFDYLGASIRYADADGNRESSTEVDIRFSYQLKEGVSVKSWGWSYKLGNQDIAIKDGKYITEDSITNLVLTNVVLCNLEKDMGVQFWFVVDIGGVEYTVYDTFRIRTAIYVIEAYADMTDETYSDAIEYAKSVQQEMLTYINTPGEE